MFLGLRILFLLVTLPFIIALFLYALKKKDKLFGKFILISYLILFSLLFISIIFGILNQKKVLDRDDYYGDYVIKRNFFKGKNTDWQYNHFRFTITKSDSIFLYLTDKDKITETLKGKISTVRSYHPSDRLKIEMENPTHHIFKTNPTTYRQAWSFYLVFYSSKFNNMYFEKGKWENIE